MKDSDFLLLKLTVDLAKQGRFTCAPNPAVGCVIVRDGAIIGRGYHRRAGAGHAEVEAINAAGGDVNGATVYVSLEPCTFVGRTPACAQLLVDKGVRRVVVAALDPHPRVSGGGIKFLKNAGVQAELIVLPEAQELIQGYASRIERGRPWVRIKTASSLDGGTALASGESQWITGPLAREDVQYWRACSDAIVTGVGTVIADDPALTVRRFDAKQPLRVILDSTLRTPPEAQVRTDGHATLFVHRQGVSAIGSQADIRCLSHDPSDLTGLLEWLSNQEDCNEVLVEAGAGVVWSFVRAGLWDEWVAYLAPKVMGEGAQKLADTVFAQMTDVPEGHIRGVDRIGDDIRVVMTREAS